MLKFKQFLNELDYTVSNSQLKNLEKQLDKLFADANIDVEFTKHFMDRVRDPRNVDDIRIAEIRDLFRKAHTKYKDTFKKLGINFEGVINDILTNLNIPFVLKQMDTDDELELVSKTIMRKKDFMTRNKKLKV